jgi:type II secretory pathway pseudopilin PulG
MRGVRGQVWIETVLYTLIALAVMGVVLAFVVPKVNQSQDRIVLEQTIVALNVLDDQIFSVRTGGTGNVRTPELTIKKGRLIIDGVENKLKYIMDESRVIFSEPGEELQEGKITIKTTEGARFNTVELVLDYSDESFLVRYDNQAIAHTIQKSPSPHKLKVENNYDSTADETIINFKLIS